MKTTLNRFRKFMDHPFMQLMYCVGFSSMAVHLWQGKMERFEYIILAILCGMFAITSFLEAVISSLTRWWFADNT